MRFPKQLFQFMPFLTGAACLAGDCNDGIAFPQTTASCVCDLAVGGISELYFVKCTEGFTEANLTSLTWWSGLLTAGTLGRSGAGLGSIAKKANVNTRVASGRPESISGITWALTYVQKCFDKTSARTTCKKLNELILRSEKYLLIARMVDGDNTILPVGVFTTTDAAWTVPDNFEEFQQVSIELSWKELGIPCTIDVAGLSGVLPKAV